MAQDPGEIPYYADDLDKARAGVATCLAKLGEHLQPLDAFFETHSSYNDAKIAAHSNISPDQVASLLEWYARLALGRKIVACLEQQGYCSFDAEV